MNRSGAMEAQQFGPSCRDGRQDNREVVSPLVDQTARRFAETRRRPGAIAVLLEQARMARRFLRAGRLSLDLGQLYRRHAGAGFGLGQGLRPCQREAA